MPIYRARNSKDLRDILDDVAFGGLTNAEIYFKREHDELVMRKVYGAGEPAPEENGGYKRRKSDGGLLSGYRAEWTSGTSMVISNKSKVNMYYETNFSGGEYLEPLISMGQKHPVGYYFTPSRNGYRAYLEPRPFMGLLDIYADGYLIDSAFENAIGQG